MVKKIIKKLLGRRLVNRMRAFRCSPAKIAKPFFRYDENHFRKFSRTFNAGTRGKLLARVIATISRGASIHGKNRFLEAA